MVYPFQLQDVQTPRLVVTIQIRCVPVHPRVGAPPRDTSGLIMTTMDFQVTLASSKSFHHLNNDAEEGHCRPKSAN